jgi:tetratricopeptide (TPR) repeat protein
VCADDTLDADLVPERVWSLVSKSVVDRPPPDGATRYRLFSTVRSRVAEHATAAELTAAASRAATHFDSIVGPNGLNSAEWASRLDTELDNIRGVVDADAEVDGGLKLRLLWSIGMLHDVRDEFALGIEEVSRRIVDAPPTAELVGVLTLLADLHLRVGRLDDAADAAHRAEVLAGQVGAAPWDLGGVDRTKGELALRRNDLDGAEQIARDALGARAAGQPAARLWNLLGLVHANRGDFGEAAAAFDQELDIWQRLGNNAAATVVHGNLAEALLRTGATSAAARHQLECLRGATDFGRPLLVGFSLTVAAHLAAESSNWTLALELQGASDALLEQAAYALYEADDQSRTELLERARLVLDADGVSTALARGHTMTTVDAAERAALVLDAAAARQ